MQAFHFPVRAIQTPPKASEADTIHEPKDRSGKTAERKTLTSLLDSARCTFYNYMKENKFLRGMLR